MRVLLLLMPALFVLGCEDRAPVIDQCLRAQHFQQCLARLPAGPRVTQYNDWAEIVSECESAARYQAYRLRTHVKPHCLGW